MGSCKKQGEVDELFSFHNLGSFVIKNYDFPR
jgi:hypothetical protein